MNRCFRIAACFILFFTGTLTVFGDIRNSKHNLSISGPGAVKAATETEVCIMCHTPHNSGIEAPLWNRFSSGSSYIPYASSTAVASYGQPTGASKLCLSCHDGTIALGMVRSRSEEISFSGSSTIPPGSTNVSTDLSDDHPVSFTFDAQLFSQKDNLLNPDLLTGAVKLDNNKQLQCTSCHNPHDNQFTKFLVQDNRASSICVTCHDQAGWNGTVHSSSNATWNSLGQDPWPHTDYTTVNDNGCENCHRPHTAGSPARILNESTSEGNCLPCHNGNVSTKDVGAEFNKLSTHPVTASELHDPSEDLINPPRHVECVDCHNPHAADTTDAVPPDAPGSLNLVRGVDSNGSGTPDAAYEYELCFRCHADSTNTGAPLVSRQFNQTNTRVETSLANASYHPVQGAGKNPNSPSLISPYTTSSIIYCTDCHNNNQGPGANGTGPNGPHGSAYSPILERQFVLTDYSSENSSTYALCYKCHSRSSILRNDSFREHKRHIKSKKTSCATCHDPHGVVNTTHLINFNTDYVTPSGSGRLEFVDQGTFKGECFLTCHGADHDPERYP